MVLPRPVTPDQPAFAMAVGPHGPLVRQEREGLIAVLTLDNPPLNCLAAALRAELAAALRLALDDRQVAAIVIMGAGRAFCGGAEIREFNTPLIHQQPRNRDISALIDAAAKPVVAAIGGLALGGGLELALSCHWRVASRNARLGLPEVTLGLLPGNGGTQRLPRAVGLAAAARMITGGQAVEAPSALAMGLVDALTDSDSLRAEAVALARTKIHIDLRRLRDGAIPAHTDQRPVAEVFAGLLRDVQQFQPGLRAPLAAIEALQAASSLPFEEGLAAEQALCGVLLNGLQSRALRRAFFIERGAAKSPGAMSASASAAVPTVVFLGGAPDGRCAELLSRNGVDWRVWESSATGGTPSGAARGAASPVLGVDLSLALSGEIGDDQLTACISRYASVQWPVLVLASDATLQHLTPRMPSLSRLIGMQSLAAHPPSGHVVWPTGHQMVQLVRLARAADATEPEALASALALVRKLGLPVVVSGLVNGSSMATLGAIAFAEQRQAWQAEGATSTAIDAMLRRCGFAAGPGTRTAVAAPSDTDSRQVNALISKLAAQAHSFVADEIAWRADDVDWLWIGGFGFPRHRGGPVFCAAHSGEDHGSR